MVHLNGKNSPLHTLSVVFLAGFLLGFGTTFRVFLNFNKPVIPLKNQTPAHRSDANINNDQQKLTAVKNIVTNLTEIKYIQDRSKESQTIILKRRVRILCWVMTANGTANKLKALAIKQTWGRRCDNLLFFAEIEDNEVPMIKIENVQPGRLGLWTKVVGALKYIHKHHSGEFDWVLRADDDTYLFSTIIQQNFNYLNKSHAIIENMREMLLPNDPNKPRYFGFLFQVHVPKGYFSGGGGIVMSKEALKIVVEGALDGKHKDCKIVNSTHSVDDINISQCLYALGVVPDDSRDFKGRGRMHCFNIEAHLNPDQGNRNWWYWNYLYWNVKGGLECCGDNVVSWHYTALHEHYMHQYLAYNVKVERVVAVTEANLTGATPNKKETTTYQPR